MKTTTVTRAIARASVGALMTGMLVGLATAPATADTTSQALAVRTVAVSTLLADNGSQNFQSGMRKGTLEGNRDGSADARSNCRRANRAQHDRGFAPSAFDDGYAKGYSIGYDKGFSNAEREFCHGSDRPNTVPNQQQSPVPAPGGTVAGTFEASGADPAADAIVTDRPGNTVNETTLRLPFHRDFTAPADTDLLQLNVTSHHQASCKIIFGGQVVAQDAGDFGARCIFQKR
jgi:hypothetical protein